MAELTRKEFYQLAQHCRDYAMRLATHDQDSVDRVLCHEFNQFREHVAGFDQLHTTALTLEKARPITRLLVVSITLGLWLIVVIMATRVLPFLSTSLVLGISTMLIFGVVLVPPRYYGTSVEEIEGRVLVVVEKMQDMLQREDLGFSEAAYFQVRDILRETNAELRQQVYLNRIDHRR